MSKWKCVIRIALKPLPQYISSVARSYVSQSLAACGGKNNENNFKRKAVYK
jgi:hypothetical protein